MVNNSPVDARSPKARWLSHRLRMWANARAKRNPFGHGKTGTQLLRDSADYMDELQKTLHRASFVAEHLMQMIDRETWRDSGADDGQGHYEGDYRAEKTYQEVKSWATM